MLESVEFEGVEAELRDKGFASLGQALSAEACRALAGLYGDEDRFRSRVQMERYRFGKGEYQYFEYPLPAAVEERRTRLYGELAPIAGRWQADLGQPVDFPASHGEFLARCAASGQTRATPLLLRYGAGDFNCLHQDLYGEVVFPFQVVIGLSRPGVDFEGGELMLVEQRPRAQSVGRVVALGQGEAVVITTRYRPVLGSRGFYRANVRHGVSVVKAGERFTLGIIFHDAE